MDSAGKDIQQLYRTAKSDFAISRRVREWLEHLETDLNADLFDGDQDVGTNYSIAFNCLLISYHATETKFRKFLQKYVQGSERFIDTHENVDEKNECRCIRNDRTIAPPFSLHDQDLRGITALHVVVYRNSLHADKIARLLLDWDGSSRKFSAKDKNAKKVSLASIPMVCGSYPLHLLTGQNLTIKAELLETLLSADPSVPFKDDINGDNPISLLWKNTLRFRWAISVMEGATYIDYIKNDDCSWMAIITPYQYIHYSLKMAGAALQNSNISEKNGRNGIATIHDLCRIPRCPPMLLRLLRSPEYKAFFGISGDAFTFDENGMLPIHHAVQNPPVNIRFIPPHLKSQCKKSLIEMLLEENPGSVRVADAEGRLPLHYALESGCVSERDLIALVLRYPESIRIKDPKNGLLPFMMVSTNHARAARCCALHDLEDDGRKNEKTLSQPMNNTSLHTETNKSHTVENHHAEWKRDHVKMTYFLLTLCPDAISSWTSDRKENQCSNCCR